MSDFLNIANTVVGILGLAYGVLSYHNIALGALWSRRSRTKLARRRDLLELLHNSPSERNAYLLQGILWCVVVGSVALIFRYIDVLHVGADALGAVRDWAVGFVVYLMALFRLGRIEDATARFERVRHQLDEAIAKWDEKSAQ